jgi:hypothetical protein
MVILLGLIVSLCSGSGYRTMLQNKRCITRYVNCAQARKIPWSKETTPPNIAKFYNKCIKQ